MSAKIMTSRFNSTCCACSKPIKKFEPIAYLGKGKAMHEACYKGTDNASHEDKCCGDMAYEDQCAAACGL